MDCQTNEFLEHTPRRQQGDRNYTEFARYYHECRCRWAPQTPDRVFRLAFSTIYPRFRHRLTKAEFLAVVYDTLGFPGAKPPGLFQTFDPDKYRGQRPLEDHFVSMFGRKLEGRAGSAVGVKRRLSDSGRKGDRFGFQPQPELGLVRDESYGPSDDRTTEAISVALKTLDPAEAAVILLKYWANLSDVRIASTLELDRATVRRRHATGLRRLRRFYGVTDEATDWSASA